MKEMTVENLIKRLEKLDNPTATIIVYERTSVYETRILGIGPDEYEKKRNKNVIRITVG